MNRNRIYITVIIFLLVTNIVTVISFRKITRKEVELSRPVIEMPHESRLGYFRGSLELDEEQMASLTGYNRDYNRKAEKINRRLVSLREQMITAISSENPDQEAIDSILNQFGAGHVELKRATIDYYKNLSSICNEEQRHNLELFFRNMLDPQGPVYSRGRGVGGRGHGMGPGQAREGQRGMGRGYGRQ